MVLRKNIKVRVCHSVAGGWRDQLKPASLAAAMTIARRAAVEHDGLDGRLEFDKRSRITKDFDILSHRWIALVEDINRAIHKSLGVEFVELKVCVLHVSTFDVVLQSDRRAR